ncbi:MAG: radical SAM protein [Candidatus Bathyarchaeia archaeon]
MIQTQIITEAELDVDRNTVDLFNDSIFKTFTAARKVIGNGELLPYAVKTIVAQRFASKRRLEWRKRGLHVPPAIIFSVTKRCNLNCKGCYAHAQHRQSTDISIERVSRLFDEAKELGTSIIVITGGEPLMRPEIIDLAYEYNDIIFPVFTNGLLINQTMALMLRYNRNIVPMISLEGPREVTDDRRGEGMYDRVSRKMKLLKNNGVFFGASITVTTENMEQVTSDEFVSELCSLGVKAVVYVEYVPVDPETEHLVLGTERRAILDERLESLRRQNKAVFIDFPGDEEKLGGCLAAGRGFIHVSQSGAVEPCPASPFSDASLGGMSLKEALNSRLLKKIRETPLSLEESHSGCALYDKEEWVKSLVQG